MVCLLMKDGCDCCKHSQAPGDHGSKLDHVATWLSGNWKVQPTSLVLWAVWHFSDVSEGKHLYFGRPEGDGEYGLKTIAEEPAH